MMEFKDNNLMRQAYIDNQLPVEQVIEFEQKLSSEDRSDIAREQQFESAFSTRLNDTVSCPDEFWQDLKTRLNAQSSTPSKSGIMFLRPILAAAAMFMLVAASTTFIIKSPDVENEKVAISFINNLEEFSRSAEVPGDYEKVRSSLTQNGYHINMKQPDPEIHHQVELLGVRYHHINGVNMAQIYLSCCKRPMSVFLTDKSVARLSDHIQIKNQPSAMHSVSNEIDQYRLHIVGPHPVGDVLDLFS